MKPKHCNIDVDGERTGQAFWGPHRQDHVRVMHAQEKEEKLKRKREIQGSKEKEERLKHEKIVLWKIYVFLFWGLDLYKAIAVYVHACIY